MRKWQRIIEGSLPFDHTGVDTSSCDKDEKLTTFVTNYRFQTWKIKENKCFRSVRNLKKL